MTKVIEQYCTKNPCSLENRPLDNVQKLIVHSPAVIKASGYKTDAIITGNEWFKRWNKSDIQKLAHGFIDIDGVHLFLPLTITGWQAGNWFGNCHSVGFELCEYTDLGKARAVYDNAVAYYADLVRKFGLTVSDVIGHKEAHDTWYASNHSDPDPYFATFGKSMKTFREDLIEYMNRQDSTAEEEVDGMKDYWAGIAIDETFSDEGGVRWVTKETPIRIAPCDEAPVREGWKAVGRGNVVTAEKKFLNGYVMVRAAGKKDQMGFMYSGNLTTHEVK